MEKKYIKVFALILIALLIASLGNVAFAAVTENFKGEVTLNSSAKNTVTTVLSVVLNILRNIGVGLAIILLMVIGCKYILASAADKAEIKKHAVTYVIGAIVLFGSSGIITILKNFTDDALGNSGGTGP